MSKNIIASPSSKLRNEWYSMCSVGIESIIHKPKKNKIFSLFKKKEKEELTKISKQEISDIILKMCGEWQYEGKNFKINPFNQISHGYYTTMEYSAKELNIWYFTEEMVLITDLLGMADLFDLCYSLGYRSDEVMKNSPYTFELCFSKSAYYRKELWSWLEKCDKVTLLNLYHPSFEVPCIYEHLDGIDVHRFDYKMTIIHSFECELNNNNIKFDSCNFCINNKQIKKDDMWGCVSLFITFCENMVGESIEV